jgi:hypothetical protein
MINSKKEIMLFGVSRSGNHMFLDWIANQHDDDKYFVNRRRLNAPLIRGHLGSNLPSMQGHIKFRHVKYNLIMYFRETSVPSPDYDSCMSSDEKHTLVMLRDFRNWVCSMYKLRGNRMKREIEVWKEHAKLYLSDPKRFVLYDRFVSDINYRNEIAELIGVDRRSDDSLMFVPNYGGFSSFDGDEYQGAGVEMSVTDRYKQCANEDWYIDIIKNNEEAVRLSSEIFA